MFLTNFRKKILNKYEGSSKILKRRAYNLFVMNAIIFVVVLIAPPTVLLGSIKRVDFINAIIITMPMLVTVPISMIFLWRGKYDVAANTTSFAAGMVIILGVIIQDAALPAVGFSSMTYFISAVIIFSSIFSGVIWTTILAVFFIAANGLFFYVLQSRGLIDFVILEAGVLNSVATIIFTYSLAMLIVKINKLNLADIKAESKKNREHYLKIQDLHTSISENSIYLSEAGDKMLMSATQVSDSSQGQAASIEEITSSVEQVTASADLVGDAIGSQLSNLDMLLKTIGQLSRSIEGMTIIIDQATDVSKSMFQKSKEGEVTIDRMSKTMLSISESSNEMTQIVDVIKQISDQISLLSLNAAIEAARAGNAGRGFAVVSDEISKLSERTMESLKSISSLITTTEQEVGKGMQDVTQTVDLMRSTIDNINIITDWMGKINKGMIEQVETNKTVLEQGQIVKLKSEEIKSSTTEQKEAFSEVAHSIMNINDLTQSNAVRAMDLASLSKGIAKIADELKAKITYSHEQDEENWD